MSKPGSDERYRCAVELVDLAECAVRAAETHLEQQTDPTQRDIAETELRNVMDLQDQAHALAGPALAARDQQVQAAAIAAVKSAAGEPGVSSLAQCRRFHSAATKAFLIKRIGAAAYRRFPW